MRFSWVCGYRVTFFCPRSMCWDEWVDILVERCIYRGGLGPMTRVRERMRPTPCLEESTNKNGRWMVACISFIILEESLWKVVILESFFMFFFAGSSLSREFSKVLRPMSYGVFKTFKRKGSSTNLQKRMLLTAQSGRMCSLTAFRL